MAINPRKMSVEALRAHQEEWNPDLHRDLEEPTLTVMQNICDVMYNLPVEEYREYLIKQQEGNVV